MSFPFSCVRFADGCSAVSLSRRSLVGFGLALAVAPQAARGGGTPAGNMVTVSTAAELLAAARAAAPGDVILLAPGHYGAANLSGIVKSGNGIIIRPATSTRPQFTALNLTNAQGLTLVNLNVVGSASPVVNLSGASDIRLAGLLVSGSPNNNPWDDANTGLWIRSASRISVASCRFQDLRLGLYVQRAAGVIIAESTFQYVREGINACASERLLLRRCRFQHFLPNYAAGEHPDAIQFWMSGETEGMRDVVVAENFMPLGDKRPVQGVFLTEGYLPPELKGTMFHEHLEVRDNIYYGSSSHGITCGFGKNVLIWKNTILASPHADINAIVNDPTGRTGSGFQPQLRLWDAYGIRVERNISTIFNLPAPGVTQSANIKLWDKQTGTGVPHAEIFGARPTALLPALSEFRVRPGSIAAAQGAGATPPATAGATSLSDSAALARVNGYHATLANFDQWFSPGF
ncbi:hypothetical protein [Thermaurantiacus sp.]